MVHIYTTTILKTTEKAFPSTHEFLDCALQRESQCFLAKTWIDVDRGKDELGGNGCSRPGDLAGQVGIPDSKECPVSA